MNEKQKIIRKIKKQAKRNNINCTNYNNNSAFNFGWSNDCFSSSEIMEY